MPARKTTYVTWRQMFLRIDSDVWTISMNAAESERNLRIHLPSRRIPLVISVSFCSVLLNLLQDPSDSYQLISLFFSGARCRSDDRLRSLGRRDPRKSASSGSQCVHTSASPGLRSTTALRPPTGEMASFGLGKPYWSWLATYIQPGRIG